MHNAAVSIGLLLTAEHSSGVPDRNSAPEMAVANNSLAISRALAMLGDAVCSRGPDLVVLLPSHHLNSSAC